MARNPTWVAEVGFPNFYLLVLEDGTSTATTDLIRCTRFESLHKARIAVDEYFCGLSPLGKFRIFEPHFLKRNSG